MGVDAAQQLGESQTCIQLLLLYLLTDKSRAPKASAARLSGHTLIALRTYTYRGPPTDVPTRVAALVVRSSLEYGRPIQREASNDRGVEYGRGKRDPYSPPTSYSSFPLLIKLDHYVRSV